MNQNHGSSSHASIISFGIVHGLTFLILLLSFGAVESTSQTRGVTQSPNSDATVRVTHVMGFEDVRHNAAGTLSIQGDSIEFRGDANPIAQVKIGSVQDIFVEDQDKEVGGTAMTLGKTAVPYGGGRVVSLFAHKKYDILTIEYLDRDGGFHGAIFQLRKGQGKTFKKDLAANGAHISYPDDRATSQSTQDSKHENR